MPLAGGNDPFVPCAPLRFAVASNPRGGGAFGSSIRDVVAEALGLWLDQLEETEDRASAAEALAEYERDGGTAAADFFDSLAAETRAEYGSDR